MNAVLSYVPNVQSYIQVSSSSQFDSEWFEMFSDYIDRKKTTVRGYISCIRQFAMWLQEHNITAPTRADIKTYKAHLEEKGFTAGTQYQYLRAVKQFFSWLSSEGLYANISDNIHTPKLSHDVHRRDEVDINAVYSSIPDTIDRTSEQGKRLYAMYMLISTCGLRTIEVNRANVGDIMTIAGKPFIYIQGKGRDEKDAPVLIERETKKAIDEYLSSRTDKYTKDSPLFIGTSNRSKGKRIATTTISTMIKSVLVNAGYDSSRLTAHSLRHSSATASIKYGLDVRDVQKLMRHSQVTTTEGYIHENNTVQNECNRQKVVDFFRNEHSDDELKKNSSIQKISLKLQLLSAEELDKVAMYINSLH